MKYKYKIYINDNDNFINFHTYWLSFDDIKEAEIHYDAFYVGSFENDKGQVLDLFYTPNPDISKGHKNYFGLFFKGDVIYITDGTNFVDKIFNGLLLETGEILISGWNHDFHHDETNNYFIDGGISYMRFGGDNLESLKFVKLKLTGCLWNIIDNE